MKGCAIGCGMIVLTLALVGGVIAWKAPHLWTMFNAVVAQEQERQLLVTNWTPPAKDAPDVDVFPPMLEGYRLVETNNRANLPELQIDVPGAHAVYRKGPSQIDLYLFPVTQLENEALFKRVEEASEKGGGSRTWTKVDLGDAYARIYLWSTNLKQNHLWYTRGHLVVFRTADEEDRENFVHAFFQWKPAATQPEVIFPPDAAPTATAKSTNEKQP